MCMFFHSWETSELVKYPFRRRRCRRCGRKEEWVSYDGCWVGWNWKNWNDGQDD